MSKENELSDEQMPVVAWYGSIARCHEVVGLKQNHVLREFEAGEIVPEALVRQSDAQAKLAAKDAEIAALKKKVGAYQLLTKSQDVRIATVRKLRDEASEAIGSLASERLANAMLTNEIDALKADAERVRADAGFPVSGLVAIEMPESAAEAECKPSLYLFLSEHGSIRYWTREADAAARRAIEFGAEPERLYAATVRASVKNITLSQHKKE